MNGSQAVKLIQKYKQFIKFGLVALSYNLAAYLIYALLIYFKYNYLMASTIAFFSGLTLSYFMNKKFVFASRHHNYAMIIRYIVFYVSLLGVNLALLHEAIYLLKINVYLAQIFVTGITALISYNVMCRFIFHRDKQYLSSKEQE